MAPAYLKTVILFCLKQINGERTIYSIFHLLKGKKSSQTIQDSHLFHLAAFFNAFSSLSRSDLEDIIRELAAAEWIQSISGQAYKLTKNGENHLLLQLAERPLPKHLNGWNYHNLTEPFWERLSILVQVCSNLINHQTKYIPIQKKTETLLWLKSFLHQQQDNRYELAEQLYEELAACLDQETELNPNVLVLRFTGHKRFGLTPDQAAERLNMDQAYFHLQFLNVLHCLLQTIIQNRGQYRLLNSLISDLNQGLPLTVSAQKTLALLKNGYAIEKIAQFRKLKSSTIEDHIVEIALHERDFDISSFVDPEKQKIILMAAQQATSKQLRHIREAAAGANYFEIRLVLAKFGDQYES